MRRVYLGALLLSAACQSSEMPIKIQPVPEATLAPAPVKEQTFPEGTSVALWSDAVLYREPKEDTERATMEFAFPRETPAREAMVMRLHREVGEFFEVEPLKVSQNKEQCFYNASSGLMGISVRLFVKKTEALPVVSRPVSLSFPDKTSVDLLEGVLAQPTTGGSYMISDGYLSFESELEADRVGRWFTVSNKRFDNPQSMEVRDITQATFGDKKFTKTPTSLWGESLESQGKQLLFSFGTPCSQYRVLVQGNSQKTPTNLFGTLLGALGPEKKYTIKSGATLYWSDGTKAGVTDELPLAKQSSITKERTCFEVPLDDRIRDLMDGPSPSTSSEKKFFVFCADNKDVIAK